MRKKYYLIPIVIFALLISPSMENLYSANAQILFPPSPPTNLTATAVSSSEIDLSWNAPSILGGLLLLGYEIERSTDGGTTWSTIVSNTGSTATTYSDMGLSPNAAYTYRVSAINSAGTSTPSNTASATTFSATTVPSSPTGLTATSGDSQVSLSWIAPTNNGGSAITGYKIYRSTSSETETLLATTGNVVTYTDSTVINGQTYFYKVTAVNSVGESAQSNESSATPAAAATAPQPPTGLTAAAASSSQINLSWTAPTNNGGSAITGYKIERSTDSGTTWSTTVANSGSQSTTYSDTGLTTSTTYTYRVSAINTIGTSTPSNTASATTQAAQATVPQPPTGLTATSASSSQINLSWTAPTSDGGSAITGYKIERSTDSGTTWSTIASNTASTSTTYSDTGLTANTSYTYRVSAINTIGTSTPSNTASATTQSSTCSTCKLTIITQLTTGDPLTGMFSSLSNQNNQVIESGFTPVTFNLTNAAQYSVGMGSFGTYTFDHWQDTGSTSDPRTVSISSDTQMTAIYTDSAVTLSPSRGPVGTTVSVTGAPSSMTFTTFSPNHTITLTWDGTAIATTPSTITSSSTGGFTATFKVPTSANGSHKVTATDGTNTHSALFDLSSSTTAISLNTNIANIGDGVRVTGNNFTPNSKITFSYDGALLDVGQQNTGIGTAIPSTVTTDSNGGFVAIISVLRSVAGAHSIGAQDSANIKATKSITVMPHVFIYPTSGHAGSQVLIPASQGNGYAANSPITIKFGNTIVSSSITSDSEGNFGGSFTIPSSSSLGTNTIQVSDGKGNTQSVSFTVTATTTPTFNVQNVTSASGLVLPDKFAFIPDNGPGVDGSGALMVVEKNSGNVIVFKNTGGKLVRQSVPFVTVPNLQAGPEDNGLLGIAFDPNWINSKMVYFDVTRTVSGSNFTEVIRYHATTDTSGNIVADKSVGEQLIIGNIPAWQDGHNGGNIEFDSHGHLYISTGDGWTFVVGQDLTTLQAKIMRIIPLATPDANGKLYSIPSDNPFASSTNTSIKKEIWGYGVRNPDSFDIDSQTGKLYVSDPGFNTWERLENFTAPGANAGWPNYEAPPVGNPQNLASYTPSVYWYPHQGMEPETGPTHGLEALTGGIFYNCSTNCYQPNLNGAYFFGDYGVGFIAALLPSSTAPPQMDAASGVLKGQIVPIYYGLAYAPIDMKVWNGKLYFLNIATGTINVLNYN